MKAEILKMLREGESYVSGQQICDILGVSRTAVWKAVNQLKDEGYQVEAVRNRGYHILESPDVVTKEELVSMMDTKWAGQNVCYFDKIDSTNIRAKQMGEEGAPHGTLIAADYQGAGRGRRGRMWESPSGSSIYMSLLIRPDIPPLNAPMLTLVMALSAADGLKECTGLDVQIKWPNDIVANGKKLAGILTEMSTEIDYINYVVIGIGINVNMREMQKDIEETATSVRIETGQVTRRSEVIASIMKKFEENYEKFLETQDLQALQEQYNHLLINKNKEVRILGANKEFTGYALGINEKGELQVKKEDGTIKSIFSGEVSVRGMYGYV